MSIFRRYNDPPAGYENTDATHYVHFPWKEDWLVSNWQANPELEERENGDIASTQCTSLHSDLPYREGSEVVIGLGHKTVLKVMSERVGIDGRYHFVEVISPNQDLNGRVGYVDIEDCIKVPGVPRSLPMNFKCSERLQGPPPDICKFGVPIWHETTEPYYDEETCEYLVSVVTRFTDTGGEGVNARMQQQIRPGVLELLEWYDKRRDAQTVDELLAAFKFAEAKSWHLDVTNPNSRLKVLISIPAKYFDAIEPESQDIFSVAEESVRIATLVSSDLEKQVEELSGLMDRFDRDQRWRKVRTQYYGPEPFYADFSFVAESKKLTAFLANFKRLLVLNGKNLRESEEDTIEIGFDSQYKIKYVLLNDEEGSHNLRIGLKTLRNTDPFNYPRTMAYIYHLFEISNEMKTSKHVKGGWPTFLKKYTFPPPKQRPSSKQKKCRPTLTDPLKCMGSEFDDYRNRHLRDFKCEELPPEQRFQLNEAGALGYQAIQTGEWDNFKDKFAPFKTDTAKLVETQDIKTFKQQIAFENDKYEGSMDFVGDPFVEELFDKLKEGNYSGGANAALKHLYEEVAQPFEVKNTIALIHQCLCNELQFLIDDAENNNASDNEVLALRLAQERAGCRNPCATIPILCSCIPFPWPPKISIPDNFNVVDIMAYLTAVIIDAILNAVINFLVDFLKDMLKQVLDCKRKPSSRQRLFIDTFKNNYPWEEDDAFDNEDVANALRRNELPPELAKPELVNLLIKDVVLLLSPREFCELLNGEARTATLEAVEAVMKERHTELLATFSNTERIRVLFLSIGSAIDPAICENLDQFLTAIPDADAGYICEETTLREDLAVGRATAQQINEMLAAAAKCNTDKLENIINITNTLTAGGDILSALVPNIFQSPQNPNGIIPREPPSVQFLQQVANTGIWSAVESRFNSEMDANVPTLITTKRLPSPPRASVVNSLSGLIQTAPAPPGETVQVIADNFATKLEDLKPLIGNGPRVITLQVPTKKITAKLGDQAQIGPGDNWFTTLSLPGYPEPAQDAAVIRREEIRIHYSLCSDTVVTTNFDRLRDGFTVKVEDVEPSTGPDIIMDFDGRKVINRDFIPLFGNLRGLAAPSQEMFSNILIRQWSSLPWHHPAIIRKLENPETSLVSFHHGRAFRDVTRDLVQQVANITAKSRFLDGGSRDFKEAFQNLKNVEFTPHPSCNPRAPGLLNLPDIKAQVSDRFNKDMTPQPQRYINSVQYGFVVAYLRVAVIEAVLNGIFPFSQFRAENLLKSDLLTSYFMNRLRTDLKGSGDEFVYNGAFPVARSNFYEEVLTTISSVMIDRKYFKKEEFVDPFTGEEVDVLLSPALVSRGFEGVIHDTDVMADRITVEDIREQEEESRPNIPGRESTNNCDIQNDPVARAFTIDLEGECQENPSDNNEEAIGTPQIKQGPLDSQTPGTGNRTIGYLEFFLKEQLKAIAGEVEVLLGTEINDINSKMIGTFARAVDVPRIAPIGPPRFYKSVYEDGLTDEQRELTISELNATNSRATYLYALIQSLVEQDLPLQGDLALAELARRVREDPTSLPPGFYNEFAPKLEEIGDGDLLQLITQELQDTYLRDVVGNNSQLRDEFFYLKDGGFVTERYVKITELSEQQWSEIDNDLAVEKIKNRGNSLKGIVSPQALDEFFTSLSFDNDQLQIVVTRDGETYIDWQKYFAKMEMGARLTYVYPLAPSSGLIPGVESDSEKSVKWIQQNLKEPAGFQQVASVVSKTKAWTLQEKTFFEFRLNSEEVTELDNLLIEGEEIFEVPTVPVISREIEVTDAIRWQGAVEDRGQNTIPGVYNTDYFSRLRSSITESTTYRALFEYVFPLDRFISLVTIYTAEHISGLPGRDGLFDETKALLRQMHYDASLTKDDSGWWKKAEPNKPRWFEQPLELSVPGIMFMTPYKILQALLLLVPPLNWFLDGLLSRIPGLPPYRSSKGDPCD